MDLGAYLQIEPLSSVMEKNGISVPRLRGLRIMAFEDPLPLDDIVAKARRQLETFNKYVGRHDVLYIHARIGGKNWEYFGGPDLEKQPWYIERVDDWFDSTYCDIYAKIGEIE